MGKERNWIKWRKKEKKKQSGNSLLREAQGVVLPLELTATHSHNQPVNEPTAIQRGQARNYI